MIPIIIRAVVVSVIYTVARRGTNDLYNYIKKKRTKQHKQELDKEKSE